MKVRRAAPLEEPTERQTVLGCMGDQDAIEALSGPVWQTIVTRFVHGLHLLNVVS